MKAEPRLELFSDTAGVTAAIGKAIRDDCLRHAKLGNPIAGMRDGKVVEISPEEVLARFAAEEAAAQKNGRAH